MHRTASDEQSEACLIAEVGLIGAVALWCECLHGRDPLLRALEVLGLGLNAEIVALARYPHDGQGAVRTVVWDRGAGSRMSADRRFAKALIGPYFDASRPGSLWFRSTVESDGASGLA